MKGKTAQSRKVLQKMAMTNGRWLPDNVFINSQVAIVHNVHSSS